MTDLCLCTGGRKDLVQLKCLHSTFVADIDQLIINRVKVNYAAVRSRTVLFDWWTHTAKHTNVACKKETIIDLCLQNLLVELSNE